MRESTPWNLGGKPCTWHVAWMFVGEPTMKLSKSPTGQNLRPLSHGNPHPRTYDIHVVLPRRSRVDVAAVFTYPALARVTALQFSQSLPVEPLLWKVWLRGIPHARCVSCWTRRGSPQPRVRRFTGQRPRESSFWRMHTPSRKICARRRTVIPLLSYGETRSVTFVRTTSCRKRTTRLWLKYAAEDRSLCLRDLPLSNSIDG